MVHQKSKGPYFYAWVRPQVTQTIRPWTPYQITISTLSASPHQIMERRYSMPRPLKIHPQFRRGIKKLSCKLQAPSFSTLGKSPAKYYQPSAPFTINRTPPPKIRQTRSNNSWIMPHHKRRKSKCSVLVVWYWQYIPMHLNFLKKTLTDAQEATISYQVTEKTPQTTVPSSTYQEPPATLCYQQ